MKIKFYGGVNTVTGSNFILEGDEEKLMIDCGLIQKERTCDLENFKPFTYDPKEIKYIFITHAHLDHIGRLPKLLKQGFNGKILSTSPTKDLAYEILKDSLKVIEENCKFYSQENFYEEEEIEKTLSLWEKIEYHQKLETKEFEVEFFNAGHILGSAFILFTHKRTKEKIVFSGDLGNKFKSLDKDLEPLPETNYLVLESTYGDRNHENLEKRKEILEEIIEKIIREKRTLIIPTFALERAQEIIFDIQELIENKEIPEIKIFLDSPLAFRISKIYEKYPKIILAGSGMVTGGRILDLLKKYIEDEKTTLLFVGFQAENSLGRKILEGVKEIFIDEKPYKVNAEILNLFSYSAHRDQRGILEWLYPQRFNLKKVFLTHGDDDVKKAFKTKIMDELALNVYIPKENDIFEL
jgi:metallo-beta-lactamase family protein